MRDFWAAIGLLLVIEGLMFAALPDHAKRAVAAILETPNEALRVVGIVCAVIGVGLIAVLRL